MTRLLRLISLLTTYFLLAALANAQADDTPEGGILGTGIVGMITDLGSIYVNGQHILLDENMDVDHGVGIDVTGQLLPEHIVAVIVTPDGSDWRARYVRQVLAIVGPVSAVEGDMLRIMGTQIITPQGNDNIQSGQWIAVSGFWQGDTIRATRLDPVPMNARVARINGTFLGPLRIGGTMLHGLTPQHLQTGDTVQVSGHPDSDGIAVEVLETGLFDENVGVVQVQGYYSAPQPDGLYTVLGSGLVAYTDQPEMISENEQVVICGADGALGLNLDKQIARIAALCGD